MIISLAEARAKRRRSSEAWCGPCSDSEGERVHLIPFLHRCGFGRTETRHYCPQCGEEFLC